jgi:hypothetical protein
MNIVARLLLACWLAFSAAGPSWGDAAAPLAAVAAVFAPDGADHGHGHDHDHADLGGNEAPGHAHGPLDHLHEAMMPLGEGAPPRPPLRGPPPMAPADGLPPGAQARLDRPPRPAA